jgi:hypothetical protein
LGQRFRSRRIHAGQCGHARSRSNAIGSLTFSNALTLAAGCSNLFEISRSPLTNDFVKVFGSLTAWRLTDCQQPVCAARSGRLVQIVQCRKFTPALSTQLFCPRLIPA